MGEMFKKVKEAADRAKDFAEEKVGQAKNFFGDVSEVVKLELEIVENKNTLEKLLLEYGKVCYYDNGSEEEKVQLKDKIIEVESVISMLETTVKTIKEEAEKKAAEKEAEKNTVFCTNCGKEYKDKEKFCSRCGSKLNK